MLSMYYAPKKFQQTIKKIALRRSANPFSYEQGAQTLPIVTHKSLKTYGPTHTFWHSAGILTDDILSDVPNIYVCVWYMRAYLIDIY